MNSEPISDIVWFSRNGELRTCLSGDATRTGAKVHMRFQNGDTNREFWYWLGWWTGAASFIFFFALFMCVRGFLSFLDLKGWQTLIAGALALVGAIWTVLSLERQIRQVRDMETDRLERRHYADRAMMPGAVNELYEYVRGCRHALRKIRAHGVGEHIVYADSSEIPKVPAFPLGSVSTVRACIETANDDDRVVLADVLMKVEITSSRLRHVREDLGRGVEEKVKREKVSKYVDDAWDLMVEITNILDYARRRAESIAASAERVSKRRSKRIERFRRVQTAKAKVKGQVGPGPGPENVVARTDDAKAEGQK